MKSLHALLTLPVVESRGGRWSEAIEAGRVALQKRSKVDQRVKDALASIVRLHDRNVHDQLSNAQTDARNLLTQLGLAPAAEESQRAVAAGTGTTYSAGLAGRSNLEGRGQEEGVEAIEKALQKAARPRAARGALAARGVQTRRTR